MNFIPILITWCLVKSCEDGMGATCLELCEISRAAAHELRLEAADAGRYASKMWHDKDYPKIQILTIEGLLDGTERIDAPPQLNPFAKAQRESKPEKHQEML